MQLQTFMKSTAKGAGYVISLQKCTRTFPVFEPLFNETTGEQLQMFEGQWTRHWNWEIEEFKRSRGYWIVCSAQGVREGVQLEQIKAEIGKEEYEKLCHVTCMEKAYDPLHMMMYA